MPPKASLKRRWASARRSYKGTTYRRKAYRRPSYKKRYVARKRYTGRRKASVKKGAARGPLRRSPAYKRYVNVSRSIKSDTGLFKLVSKKQSDGYISYNQLTHTPWIKCYNFIQNSLNSANLTNYVTTAIGIPLPPGLTTKVYNQFLHTRILCSRLTLRLTRADGVDISPMRVCLAPVNANDYSLYVSNQYTATPTWQPSGAATAGEQFTSLTMVRGARVKTLGPAAAPGSTTPSRVTLSSTVMQSTMNLEPDARIDPKYNENKINGISANPDANWWIFAIHAGDPTGAGLVEFTLEITQTWWIKAWQPFTPWIVHSKGYADEAKESKDEKKKPEDEEEKDMDVALEDFQDLSVAAPDPPRPAAMPPAPSPATATPAAAAVPAPRPIPVPAALKRCSANAGSIVKK